MDTLVDTRFPFLAKADQTGLCLEYKQLTERMVQAESMYRTQAQQASQEQAAAAARAAAEQANQRTQQAAQNVAPPAGSCPPAGGNGAVPMQLDLDKLGAEKRKAIEAILTDDSVEPANKR